MENLKYFEILSKKRELKRTITADPLKFKVLGNITVNQFNDIAEYFFLSQNINVDFESGNYDNIIQDAKNSSGFDGVFIFWEIANLINGLHYKINTFSDEEYSQIVRKVKSELDLLLPELSKFPMVIFNRFSSLIFNNSFRKRNRFDELCDDLNHYAESKFPAHLFFADINKVISGISVEKAYNSREYLSSKALYTVEFYKNYIRFTAPYIMSLIGKVKKALILDCDNTLWKGIVGEDGYDGIKMSENDKSGMPFHEAQYLFSELNKSGVLLGLCSKNNPEDVERVFRDHPDMVLKNEHITIKKINWNNKAQNLREIAEELNIGLNSLVFIDDSDFEINLVKEQVPEVVAIQVPKKTHQYPDLIRKSFSLFFKNSITEEDKKKTEQYAEQVKRKEEAKKHESFDDYLRSLEMHIKIFKNDIKIIERMSQMTQKTNQFNLTTKRYTESQIESFVKDPDVDVYALGVSDKFGESGITGLALIKYTDDSAEIDTFLMSCRVIGRNIEFKFFNFVFDQIQRNSVFAQYIKTKKNDQTSTFYDKLGFTLTEKDDVCKKYMILKNNYIGGNFDYIKLTTEPKM